MLELNAESQPKTTAQLTLHNQDTAHLAILQLVAHLDFHVWPITKQLMELTLTLVLLNPAVQL